MCVLKRMGMKEKTDFIGFEVFLFFIERRNLRERRENKCQGAHIEWLFLVFSGECMGVLGIYPTTLLHFTFLEKQILTNPNEIQNL